MELAPGQIVADYEIVRELGAGGMGKVFQVRNTISDRMEAMKVLLTDLNANADLAERFLREIKISASLDHPNIACLRTALRFENQLVMVMEYVEGATLDVRMKSGRIPIADGMKYISQAISGLAYAHAHGVIHRDIKPANIIIMPSGAVKVLDFGIASIATDHKLTKTGYMVGSLHYMSPEQIEGRPLDTRSDIYSMGVSLYEVITGKKPFDGGSEFSIMSAHLKDAPQRPSDIEPSIPSQLSEIILMALAKDPAARFQSAEAFGKALESIGTPGHATATQARPVHSFIPPLPPPPPPMAPKPVAQKKDRRVLYMTLGSLVTLGLLAAAIIEIPKFLHTNAGTTVQSSVQSSAQSPEVAGQPNSPSVATPVATQVIPEAVNPEANKPVTGPPDPVTRTARTSQPNKGNGSNFDRFPQQPQVQSPAQSQAQPQAPAMPTQSPLPPSQPQAQVPQVDAAEISELRDQLMLMSTRVGAARTSIQNLQKEQSRQGVGMRGDIVATQHRVDYQMGEAEDAIKNKDIAAAKKRLSGAERDLEILEKFLGR